MKRSRLNRKTPMPRGEQRSWNSTLSTTSPKKRKHLRTTAPRRRSYKAEFLMCQCCIKRKAEDVHEIARGIHKEESEKHPATWLCLCRKCHDEMDDYSVWPIARQLALKLVADPSRFSLSKINEIRGRALDAITLADVAQYLEVK